MPNELVFVPRSAGDGHSQPGPLGSGRYEDPEEEWDLPPTDLGYGPRDAADTGPVHDAQSRHAAAIADADAAQARRQGDLGFALIRESDAGDLRQTLWDWGDLRTWLWFGAMFFGFLLLVAICYFMPEGRHASPPMARFY